MFQKCLICEKSVPYEGGDYGRRKRYNCPDCGEYQIAQGAKDVLASQPSVLGQIVKSNRHHNTESTILDIALDGKEIILQALKR